MMTEEEKTEIKEAVKEGIAAAFYFLWDAKYIIGIIVFLQNIKYL